MRVWRQSGKAMDREAAIKVLKAITKLLRSGGYEGNGIVPHPMELGIYLKDVYEFFEEEER